MTHKRITLSEDRVRAVEVAPAPSAGARRWLSVYEDILKGSRPAVYMTHEAFSQVNAHAGSEPQHEVGGMLVGEARQTPEGGLYVVVEGHLPARLVRHGPAHLTFTSDTQIDLLDRLEEIFPTKQIVGWYHTHPGMGVFLSSMDVWLHSHFFPKSWHVALVIDPLAGEGGFFCYITTKQEFLHPLCYVGFYGLAWESRDDAAPWRNLRPDVSGERDLYGDEDGLS